MSIPVDPLLRSGLIVEVPQAEPAVGGRFEDVVPHLTIADRCPLQQMQSAERLVEEHLPIACVATEVSLMTQRDASGVWARAASFALGGAPL